MTNTKPLILVVEDEYIIALDIKEILEKEGFSVISEIDSIEHAIAIIKEQNPILVLLDVNLKMNRDGIDIGQFLLEFDKIPFIYITSSSDKITIDRIKGTRPYGFITKPFKAIDIITNVTIVLNNFNHRNIDVVREANNNADTIINESPFIIKKTIQYINDHIYESIKIEELVKLTKWEKHHFLRMFTKYIGLTPYQYILSRKMDIAKSLLIETALPIIDIAYELGFNSHSNFSIRFKKLTGNTPDDYRKINKTKKWM
jgi:AraC-like DNA-binding protein